MLFRGDKSNIRTYIIQCQNECWEHDQTGSYMATGREEDTVVELDSNADSPVGTSSQCFLTAYSPRPPMEREERAKSQTGAKGLL